MIEMYAIIAVALVAFGLALGIVMVTSLAVRDEKKAGRRLATSSPTGRARGARTLAALEVRRPDADS